MQVRNDVYPATDDQKRAMREPGPPGPVVMVNLLKFRQKAVYRDGRTTDLSGREAYRLYVETIDPLIRGLGGRLVFEGAVTELMLGRVDELWDEVVLAEYPTRATLLAMNRMPEWQAAAVHREAGLEGQLLIETTPGTTGR